jgi:alpha-tubulin suppressor-like RCC1 family protein
VAAGNGGSDDAGTPMPVDLPRPAVALAAGGAHTCAVLDDASLMCWGANTVGQLAIDRPRQPDPVGADVDS